MLEVHKNRSKKDFDLKFVIMAFFKIWLLLYSVNIISIHSNFCPCCTVHSTVVTGRTKRVITELPKRSVLENKNTLLLINSWRKSFKTPSASVRLCSESTGHLSQWHHTTPGLIWGKRNKPSSVPLTTESWCPTARGSRHTRPVGKKVCFLFSGITLRPGKGHMLGEGHYLTCNYQW